MGWKKTICYLCNFEAEELDYYRNLRVRCDNCETFYSLSADVRKFRLDEETSLLRVDHAVKEYTRLTDNQRQNLIAFVHKHEDPTGKTPVMIDKKTLDAM